MKTYQGPEGLASQYHGCGWALGAVSGGQLVRIVYLEDVSPAFQAAQEQIGFENHEAFFVKQIVQLAELAPTVRELQALGDVSVGMLSSWEFTEL